LSGLGAPVWVRYLARIEPSLVQDSRYKDGTTKAGSLAFSSVPYRALQCDRCLVITTRSNRSAPFRRKRGFKSRRGRQFNTLQEELSTLCLTRGSEIVGAAVSKTDQQKLVIFTIIVLDPTHFRTRRDYVRLRFGGNDCRSSVDCFCRAQSMNPKLRARAKRAQY
jgi:hypothetical protein